MKRLIGLSLFLILALSLAACTTSPATTTTSMPAVSTTLTAAAGSTASAGGTVDISMKGIAFVPKDVSIKVGTTVVWTNNDSIDHNVTSDTGAFSSGNMAPGATYQFTFTTAGTYPYTCSIHVPNMVGTITVTQ